MTKWWIKKKCIAHYNDNTHTFIISVGGARRRYSRRYWSGVRGRRIPRVSGVRDYVDKWQGHAVVSRVAFLQRYIHFNICRAVSSCVNRVKVFRGCMMPYFISSGISITFLGCFILLEDENKKMYLMLTYLSIRI